MNAQTIAEYLEASPGGSEQLRTRLVSVGAGVIGPVLHQTLQVLRTRGGDLASVLKKTAEMSANLGIEKAADPNFDAEMKAGLPVVTSSSLSLAS